MTERCVCGHDFCEHEGTVATDMETVIPVHLVCTGDLGGCECEEFTYLGEEDKDDG